MNRRARHGVIAVALASAAISVPAVALGAAAPMPPIGEPDLVATPTGIEPVVRDVLVRFRSGTAARAQSGVRSRALDAAGAVPDEAHRIEGLPGAWRVPVDEGASPASVARSLDARADVKWAVPAVPGRIQVTPNDPLFPNLWGLSNTGQQVPAATPFTGMAGVDLAARGAWATTRGSADVSVAVVDSGTVMDHPDLAANLRTANDRNFVGDYAGDVDPNAVEDLNRHGSHVAGTIGAVGNNGLGVAGVTWTAGMTTVRVCNLFGQCPAIPEGLAYAGSKARIVNASLGGSGSLQPATDAIQQSPNTLFVVAAGNDGTDNDVAPKQPCNVPLPNVLCVAAIDANGALADFSNYGATSVDVAAPGVGIQSAVPNFETAFAPAINSDGGTPARPDGWTQTPANQWAWAQTSTGLGYAKLDTTPGSGSGVDDWIIQAPGSFTPAGQACRFQAQIAVNLNPAADQAMALFYRTAGNPTWQMVPESGTNGDSEGDFIPWDVDLSMIDGQAGVELRFLVQSPQGAGALFAGIVEPKVRCIVPQDTGGNYDFLSGTSMATPHVSGVAALLLAKNPGLTAVQLKEAIMSTTVPMASLAGKVVTGGRVDASAALAAVPAPSTPASPSTPAATTTSLARALALRVGRTIAVRRGARTARVPVTCEETGTATCAVTVALRMRAARRGSTRARWIALGTRRVTLPAGWRGRVSVPLTSTGRALLARHPRVRTTVIVAAQKGSAARAPVRQATTLVRR